MVSLLPAEKSGNRAASSGLRGVIIDRLRKAFSAPAVVLEEPEERDGSGPGCIQGQRVRERRPSSDGELGVDIEARWVDEY